MTSLSHFTQASILTKCLHGWWDNGTRIGSWWWGDDDGNTTAIEYYDVGGNLIGYAWYKTYYGVDNAWQHKEAYKYHINT